MKTIGFVDLYLSEWHANHYPAWIRAASEALGEEYTVRYAWAEEDVSAVDGRTSAEWCKDLAVEQCATLAELCEKSDCIIILAPSNPETHLRYAKEVLPYKKPTYIDKTFAPDLKTAEEIFDIAEKCGTKFFTTSALRYADELAEYAGACDVATVFGSGASVEEYVIHQTEMLVKLVGLGACRVRAERAKDQFLFRVEYPDERRGCILFTEGYGMPAAILPHTGTGPSQYREIKSDFFAALMREILRFFSSGEVPFDGAQTLEVMRLREGLVKAKAMPDTWIALR